jgi:glycosyltransferase involved in cell wall biosynthesis
VNEVPDEIRLLAAERAAMRQARDFPAADELRERIRSLGYEVTDRPDGGFDLAPAGLEGLDANARVRTGEVPSVLPSTPTADISVQWLSEGWPEDVIRGIASFRRFEGGRAVHHVVVEAGPEAPETWPEDVEVISLAEDPGFGAARNAGLRRSRGRVVLVVDGSVEVAGDPYGPVQDALADPSVGVVGPYGLVTTDLREFREDQGPEVDAVEGYLMAFRRELLAQGVAFDDRYRFYRAADIDLCFQARAMGLRVLRVEVPARRHEHRRWAATSEVDRARLSKRNFYRFLDKFRGRTDLLVSSR